LHSFPTRRSSDLEQVKEIEVNAKNTVNDAKNLAWIAYITPILKERKEVTDMMDAIGQESANAELINQIKDELNKIKEPIRKDILEASKRILRIIRTENILAKEQLINWL